MTKTKLERLTAEQEAMLPAFRDFGLQIGLSTERTDRVAADMAIRAHYRACGLAEPEIRWFDSPWASVWASVRASVWASVGARVGAHCDAEVVVTDAWLVADADKQDAPRVQLTEAEYERFEIEVNEDPATWEVEDDYWV